LIIVNESKAKEGEVVELFQRLQLGVPLNSGEKENAIRLIREALAQGLRYTWLHPVMDLEPLGDYPPFKELIKPKG